MGNSVENKAGLLIITGRSDFGGGPKNVYRLLEGLDKTKLRVCVASPGEPPFGRLYQSVPGVRASELPLRPRAVLKLSALFGLRTLWELVQIVRQEKIAIIHSQDKSAAVWARVLKLMFWRIKLVHHYRGLHYRDYAPMMQKLYFWLEKLQAVLTFRFVHVSRSEADEARRIFDLPADRQVVVHNGVEMPEEAKALEEKIFGRNQLSGPNPVNRSRYAPESFHGVTIARFCHQKNLKATFSIMGQLKAKIPNLLLTIVGGPDQFTLEQMLDEATQSGAEKHIRFAGYQSKITDYLAGADFYLSTALWEGLPTAILEAMATGLPVVASRVTGNVDAVNEQTGFLIDLADEQKFCEAVEKLYKNIELRKKLGEQAKRDAYQRFGVAKMVSGMEEVYGQCWEAGRNR